MSEINSNEFLIETFGLENISFHSKDPGRVVRIAIHDEEHYEIALNLLKGSITGEIPANNFPVLTMIGVLTDFEIKHNLQYNFNDWDERRLCDL